MAIATAGLRINLTMVRACCEILDRFRREGSCGLVASGVDGLATQGAHFPYFRGNPALGQQAPQK